MRFKCEINMDNAAFEYQQSELTYILERMQEQVWTGQDKATIFDSNGNKVGQWEIEE